MVVGHAPLAPPDLRLFPVNCVAERTLVGCWTAVTRRRCVSARSGFSNWWPVRGSARRSRAARRASVHDLAPDADPYAFGAKVPEPRQEAPAASEVPQLFGPQLTAGDARPSTSIPRPSPGSTLSTDWAELVAPTVSLPNGTAGRDAVIGELVAPVGAEKQQPKKRGKTSTPNCWARSAVFPC